MAAVRSPLVMGLAGVASAAYNCPGSSSWVHASMEVTATAHASCADVKAEIEARVNAEGGWKDPHNAGIYSLLESDSTSVIKTQRTTNPATSVGGKLYTDKQNFELTDADGSCQIKACSESQGTSVGDFSTNYCDIRNLYCGSADGCSPARKDFTSDENDHTGSLGAGHDFSKCLVKSESAAKLEAAASDDYSCPGSGSFVHASMKVTATVSATCADVKSEIKARANAQGGWKDPHNGGIYSVLESDTDNMIKTQRTTNPKTSVGGQVYTDKQNFVLRDNGGSCVIMACSESQGTSVADMSTNYCDIRNLYCGSADGCTPIDHDFASNEKNHSGSLGAGHDFSKCIVKTESAEQLEAAASDDYSCPGSGSFVHASMKVTTTASATCADVKAEIKARASAQGGWKDPHNGGIYSVLDSDSSNMIKTQRTTNPQTSVGGQVYTDKQNFVLNDTGGSCEITACSESQGTSVADMSTNYCDIRNLYCGSADGCTPIDHDFASNEHSHSGSVGAGHDFSKCIVKAQHFVTV